MQQNRYESLNFKELSFSKSLSRSMHKLCFIFNIVLFNLVLLFSSVASASKGADELHIIHTYAKDELADILNAFAKDNGLKPRIEFYWQDQLKTNLLRLIELGKAPDVILQPSDHLGLHQYAHYSEIDRNKLGAKLSNRVWESAYSDGGLYGAPVFQGNHLMLYYNKSLSAQPAADWIDLFKQEADFKDRGFRAIAWSYDEPFWFLPFLGAFGGWPIHEGKITLDTPEMAKALEFYKSLRTRNLPAPDCSLPCTMDLFKKEKVAYTINGEWAAKDFHDVLGDKLGIAPIPQVEGKTVIATFATHVLAFPNNGLQGEHSEMLYKLINYLQSTKVQKQVWDVMGAIPVEQDAFQYAASTANDYRREMITLMNNTRALPSDQAMTFIWDAIGKGFIRHQEGAVNAPQATKLMQKLADRHIRRVERMAEREKAKQEEAEKAAKDMTPTE